MFRLDQRPTTQTVERSYVPALWRVTSKYRGFARRMDRHQPDRLRQRIQKFYCRDDRHRNACRNGNGAEVRNHTRADMGRARELDKGVAASRVPPRIVVWLRSEPRLIAPCRRANLRVERSSAAALGSRADTAIRRAWRSFAHIRENSRGLCDFGHSVSCDRKL